MPNDKYDDADWHYSDAVFSEKSLPPENGGTHIGFFVAWVLMNGMESDSLRAESAEEIAKVKSRQITGRQFLFESCDEKLMACDLNEDANAFAVAYYDRYLGDFDTALGSRAPGTYEVEDSWENYDAMAAVIGDRYTEFRARGPRAWWQFWKR